MLVKLLIPLLPLLVIALFRRLLQKQRFITSLKVSDIESLSAGPCKVEGKIVAPEALVSPYYKQSCIGYLYKKLEISTNSDGEEHYKTIHSESVCNDFYLTDHTGEIKVPASCIDLEFCTSRCEQKGNIQHIEHLLSLYQTITLSGTVRQEGLRWEFCSAKPLLASTNDKSRSFSDYIIALRKTKWFYLPSYIVINYLVFFYDVPAQEVHGGVVFLSLFGLPIAGLFLMLFARRYPLFGILSGVCIISCLLSFPLLMLMSLLELPVPIILYSLLSIVATVALVTLVFEKDRES